MGTNYIAPTWRQPENLNKDRLSNYSLDFNNSVTSKINCGPANAYNVLTLSAWVKPNNPALYAGIFGTRNGASLNFPYQLTVNNTKRFRFLFSGTTQVISDNQFVDGIWYHVVGIFDGTTLKMYVNGELQGDTATSSSVTTPNNDLMIGAQWNTDAQFVWNGEISQCSLFDYALSDSQINYLYGLNNPMAIPGAEPIAYYPLGDNSNPTANSGYPNIVSAADSVFDFTTNGYITLPTVPELGMAGASNYTTNIWINRDSTAQEGILGYNYANPNGSGWYLWANGTTLTAQLGYDGGTSNPYGTWKYTIPSADFIGSWHMITMVFDGSQTGQDRLKVYYDGVEPSGAFYTDANLFPSVLPNGVSLDQNRNVYLGVLQTGTNPAAGLGPSYLFNGQMSNAEFWKDSLTSAEVLTLYNNGLPLDGGQPEADKLRAWYKLNQSAVLTPGVPTSWSIEKVGNPTYSGSNNGCWTTGGVLNWQDTDSQLLSEGDYFTFLSPKILYSGSVTLSTTGGQWKSSTSEIEYSLEYNIDDGGWTVWKADQDSYFSSFVSWTASSVTTTVSSSIQVRLRATGGLFGSSQFQLYDMTISGATTLFTETFGTADIGWEDSDYNPPPASSSADEWDIPDNRSAYPQSFKFDGFDDLITLNKPSGWEDNQVHCISLWIKNQNSGIGYVISNRGGSSVSPGFSFIVNGTSTGYIFSNTVTSKIATGYQAALKIPNDGEWHHVLWTHQPITNILRAYIDGVYKYTKTGSVGTDATPSVGALIGNSGGAPWKGKLSNIMLWEQIVLSDGNVSLSNSASGQVAEVYNNGVPLPTASVEPSNLKAWYKIDKPTSIWNGTNWNIENQKYPANYFKAIDTTTYGGFQTSNTSLSDFMGSSATKFTWSMWVKNTAGDAGSSSLVSFSRPNSGGYASNIVNWYNNLSLFGTASDKITFGSINDGSWKHVLIAVDLTAGSTWDDCVKCFINGDPRSMVSFTGTPPTSFDWTVSGSNQRAVGIGVGYGNFHSFHGDISNYTLYNSTLGQTEATALFNNGTPVTSAVGSPTAWWKINNLTTGLEDVSGNSYNIGTYGSGQVEMDTFVSSEAVTSSNMTEANLIDDNVSTVNAESDTLPGTALVQSDLTRKLPFSNYSIQLDGLDYFKYTGTDFEFGDGTNDTSFSISTWVKLDGVGSTWVSCGSTTQRRYRLGTRGTGVLTFELYSNNTSSNSLVFDSTSTTLLTPETWYNVIASYNAANTTLKLFIDGQEVVGTLTNNSYTAMGTGSTEMNFGRFFSNGANYTEGWISNFCFYKQIISNEEALDMYNNGIPSDLNSSFTPGTPYAWFPMDQNYTYFNGTVLVARDNVGALDLEGVNVIQSDIVGNAPGSDVNGTGTNLTIADLKGDMKSSINNSYSINMADYADGVTNPANSGRSTNVP